MKDPSMEIELATASELDPRIRIRAPLRCDGIGRLDCAEDTQSGERLAIRWLPLDANGDAAVRACAKLPAHPTLPRIFQTGHVGTSAFVAMDFPEGKLLSTQVGNGQRVSVETVVGIACQVAGALATVHEQHVVHGELSPDSILLVGTNRAYLWDLPLIIANRLSDRRGENRLIQNLVKTAPFLAPERARGEGSSQASDIYSLGVVLTVAVGGTLPTAATTLGVVHQLSSGLWTPRVPLTLPDPFRSLVQRMVQQDPALRPSASEVARVFSEALPPIAFNTVPEMPIVRLPPPVELEPSNVQPLELAPDADVLDPIDDEDVISAASLIDEDELKASAVSDATPLLEVQTGPSTDGVSTDPRIAIPEGVLFASAKPAAGGTWKRYVSVGMGVVVGLVLALALFVRVAGDALDLPFLSSVEHVEPAPVIPPPAPVPLPVEPKAEAAVSAPVPPPAPIATEPEELEPLHQMKAVEPSPVAMPPKARIRPVRIQPKAAVAAPVAGPVEAAPAPEPAPVRPRRPVTSKAVVPLVPKSDF